MKFGTLSLLSLCCLGFGGKIVALNTLENLSAWASKEKSALVELQKVIESEEVFEDITDYVAKRNNQNIVFDFGLSYGRLNVALDDCLKEIRSFNDKENKKPQILDIGAGSGQTSWKFLAANALYHAVEINPANAQKILSRIITQKKFVDVPDGEKFDDQFRILRADFLQNALQAKLQRGSYDFIWCSKFLHYIDVNKIKETLKNISELLSENGTGYLITSAPSGTAEVIAKYETNRESNLAFPGFFAINKIYYTWHKATGEKIAVGWAIDSVENVLVDGIQPGERGSQQCLTSRSNIS